MIIIIPAGGGGTRLGRQAKEIPKQMVFHWEQTHS